MPVVRGKTKNRTALKAITYTPALSGA